MIYDYILYMYSCIYTQGIIEKESLHSIDPHKLLNSIKENGIPESRAVLS